MKTWTKEDVEFLMNNYDNTSNEILSHLLKKTKKSIDMKAIRLGLKKNISYISGVNKNRVLKNRWKEKAWTKEDIDFLIKNINILSNKELSIKLNKTKDSIVYMCGRMNIKRISKYNKVHIEEECLKYITKSEMRLADPNLYRWLYSNGKMNEFTSHMLNISYSTPQLILAHVLNIFGRSYSYNNRIAIKPYELDILFDEYNLAFEYDGKYRHPYTNDFKNKLCLSKNIKLIVINENSLLKRNCETYTDNIKSQIISNIDIINSMLKTNISKDDVKNISIVKNEIFKGLFDIEKIKKICNMYNDYSLFIKERKDVYNKLYYLGLLREYTKHMNNFSNNENLKYIIESKNFYKIGDIVLIEYWYNNMICRVKIKNKVGKYYEVTHNIIGSKIRNAPDEKIRACDIIDVDRTI